MENNILQKSILEEWVAGCKTAKGPKALRSLRKKIGQKYDVPPNVVEGIVRLGATQGLTRTGGGEIQGGRTYEPIDPVEWLENHEERVSTLERDQNDLSDEIVKAGEQTEAVLLHYFRIGQTGRRLRNRGAIDLKTLPRLKKR